MMKIDSYEIHIMVKNTVVKLASYVFLVFLGFVWLVTYQAVLEKQSYMLIIC
jgi:hypothetical protein